MTPTLPAWVVKRDGRREPFDADKISQGLYAATEANGSPNAFLARELADGVLHFLGQENDAVEPTTTQIAELTEKIVRELGHPNLAQAYGRQTQTTIPPAPSGKAARQQGVFNFSVTDPAVSVAASCLRAFSLQAVFTRDLAAAHDEGLLVLGGLETPEQLDATVVEVPAVDFEVSPCFLGCGQVAYAQQRTGRFLIVDSPEWLFAAHGPVWLESFLIQLEAYNRYAIFNVNLAIPPAWAAAAPTGPLFGSAENAGQLPEAKVAAFWTVLTGQRLQRLRIDWHLQSKDLPPDYVLRRLRQQDRTLPWLTFVCDRARRPIMLSEATDRTQPAVLLEVGLPLPRFLAKPGIDGDVKKFQEKLPSLVRMAASAGVQKRNFLRRVQPELARRFVLERARLALAPLALDEAVRTLTGASVVQSKLALETARQILLALNQAAERESRAANLDIVVTTPCQVRGEPATTPSATAWETAIAAAGALQEVAHGAWVDVTAPSAAEDDWRRLVAAVWQQSSVQRFRVKLTDDGPPGWANRG